MFSINSLNSLKDLGQRLRRIRIDRDESQQRFAARLGTSIPTLRKMENGDPGVSIGLWFHALYLIDRLSDIDHLLKGQQTLFDQWDQPSIKRRRRASKKREQ
jgi:transcriptional regulator with XRE-family HTH domain